MNDLQIIVKKNPGYKFISMEENDTTIFLNFESEIKKEDFILFENKKKDNSFICHIKEVCSGNTLYYYIKYNIYDPVYTKKVLMDSYMYNSNEYKITKLTEDEVNEMFNKGLKELNLKYDKNSHKLNLWRPEAKEKYYVIDRLTTNPGNTGIVEKIYNPEKEKITTNNCFSNFEVANIFKNSYLCPAFNVLNKVEDLDILLYPRGK